MLSLSHFLVDVFPSSDLIHIGGSDGFQDQFDGADFLLRLEVSKIKVESSPQRSLMLLCPTSLSYFLFAISSGHNFSETNMSLCSHQLSSDADMSFWCQSLDGLLL